MEWNVKWDWGDLMMFGSEACGSLKELQLTDWGVDQEGELDRRSFNLSGFGGSVGGYGSDMGRSSSIKSSISASTDSSPNETLKASSFTFEASNGSQGNLGKDVEQCRDEPYGCSPPMEALIGYDGPLTGLKLGKRTVESNSGGINVKLPSSSTIPVSSVSAAKKKKSSSQNALIPCCLVEGCNLDLSSAKEYHRKHRVCHSHSKCPKVIIGGAERRFCQQCSRFHSLSDFDEKKRSCRRRLSDHNARRRKPQQETIQFNSTRLSSWFYVFYRYHTIVFPCTCSASGDNSKSMNFVFNNGLLLQSKTTADSTWGTSEVPKFTITRGLTSKPYRAGSINVQSLVGGIKLPGATKMQTNASKGTTTEFFSQGVKENMFSLNMGAAPELPCALSLLSNKSSSEPESTSIGHPTHVNQISITEQVIPENLPLGSTDLWQAEQYLLNPRIHALVANGYSGGSFQLSKDPFDNFYFNGLMN